MDGEGRVGPSRACFVVSRTSPLIGERRRRQFLQRNILTDGW